MTTLGTFPHIDVPWDNLEDSAMDMGTRAGTTSSYLKDAQTAWKRLSGAYEHDETQATVYTALDDLTTPVENWSDALGTAKTAIGDFVDTGRKPQKESESLSAALPGLKAKVEADPDGEDSETSAQVNDFNERARQLRSDWKVAQSTAADTLDGITAGTGSTLPMSETLGGPSLPKVSWADFTSGLDEDFGEVRPEDLLASLRGLSTEELRTWAVANPEAAAVLANNELTAGPTPGSAEAIMWEVVQNNDELTPEGIDGIRNAWLGLDSTDQERLFMLYPGQFGSLNGVPMAARASANIITVAGFREIVRIKRQKLGDKPVRDDYSRERPSGRGSILGDQGTGEFINDVAAWNAESKRLDSMTQGLDFATENGSQIVLLSLKGDGRVVSMQGTPTSSTSNVSTLVPGTGADLSQLDSYTERLDAINGVADPEAVSFYWQGADLPDEILDNATSKYNEDGGERLAAFDYAVDAEVPRSARSTYVGYSAGGSMLGTAEREGLTSSNIVYVAPAGTGHDVGSPEDTANNSEAHRYWAQTRDDPIHHAQDWGGGYHGSSFWSGSQPDHQMGAIRLESGFENPKNPDSIMNGHTDYFGKKSTAAANIRSVIEGGDVSLYVEDQRGAGPGGHPYSPLEEHPEDYAYGKLETVSTESLEAP